MSLRLRPLSHLLVVTAVLAVALFAGASRSDAAGGPWGDQGHFGELSSELNAPMAAFGVNPADGSLWVVDTVGTEPEMLRLQKFEKVGGTWKVVASHLLGPNETTKEAAKEVEGVAFDTKEKRAYVLVTESRLRAHNEEEQAASELWAFSTETSGGNIEPAPETKAGVLVPRTEASVTGSPVGKKEFAPDSAEKGTTLFAPGGIAVNPTNDQVLVTGWIGSEEHAKPEVWAVSDKGEIQTVWEDKTKYFEECGCVTSPVVTSAGKILVLGSNLAEITELPSDLSSATAPKQAFWLPRFQECEERITNKETPCPFVEKVAQIEDGSEVGAEMSIGEEGNVYVHVKIRNVAEGGLKDGAVMVLSPTLQEIGWTGGGSWGSATKECAVNETNPGNLGPALVAGYKENVFMFERGNPAEPGEHQPKVLELGEKEGKAGNCPQGSATPPVAEAGGAKLSSFPIADNVTLSSEVIQANALGTEWEFGDGATQTVGQRQQELTHVQHQFKKDGTLNVVERIHSDDLATPTITVSEKITIVAPTVTGEQATPEVTSASLKAEVNPMKSPTKCEFQVAEASEPFSGAGVKKIACPTNPGEAEKLVPETATVTGLTSGKRYHFRLLAKAGAWESSQAGTEFEIAAEGAPAVETKPATDVAAETATLNGAVNPKGKETKACVFEYGTALPSGKTAACVTSPGKGEAPVAVSANVTGLTGATAYRFKLIDENAEGKKAEGTALSFTTAEPPSAPSAETGAASPVTPTTATLKGFVDPHGEATTCVFEYGTTTAYGSTAPCASPPGSATSKVEVSAAISGLAAGTAYHYRLTATNHTGTTQGADKELKTTGGPSGGPPPVEKTETPPGGGVEHEITQKPVPIVTVSGSAANVSPNGAFTLRLSCPAGETTCLGSVLLKTLTAVAASSAHGAKAKKKKAILTLASASFSIAGGTPKAISLHLTSKAKALLAKLHTLRAKVTIVAHDPQGGAHTTTAIVTLKAVKKKR